MAKYKEFPEADGCYNRPGYVKGNPLNNDSYLEKSCEVYPEWANVLREAHTRLEALVPGYNIAQIKEKFWELRYYIDLPEGTPQEAAKQAWSITQEAEAKAGLLR